MTIDATSSPPIPSDINGQFRIENVLGSGAGHLRVDGLTATHVGGDPGSEVPVGSFPALSYEVLIVPNAANSLPTPVLLPPLDPDNARSYSTTEDTELTVADIEGLKMVVKAGSMKLSGVPAPDGTIITLNQVHFDDVLMPMPDGAAPPFAWTLQPAGATFDPPVEIVYPNMSGLPAGSIAYFLSFNHDTNRFEIVATGHVLDDGSCIVTDPGAGITKAGWGCNCPPYSVASDCCKCGPCQRCVDDKCVNECDSGETCCVHPDTGEQACRPEALIQCEDVHGPQY